MKILVVTQYFWPEGFRINGVVDTLVLSGHEVTVLTGQPNYPDGVVKPGYRVFGVKTERRNGATIHRVPLFPRGRGGAVRLVLNYFSFVLFGCLFGPWMTRHHTFDVVFVYGPSPILQAIPGILLARLKRAALATWIQDLWPESLRATGYIRNEFLLLKVGWVVRWIYRSNDLLLVPSRSFFEPVKLMAGAVPVEYLPNPGDPAHTVSSQVPDIKLPQGFNVIFAGNMGFAQALPTVLDAVELLREKPLFNLVMLGSGSRKEWLQREAQDRGLTNVYFPGQFPADAMPALLRQASVLLVSLAKDPALERTVPSKLQAYLSVGRPIIAAMNGEGARIVGESGAGITCPAESAQELANAILKIQAMSELERSEMGTNGMKYYADHFDLNGLCTSLVGLLETVVKRT